MVTWSFLLPFAYFARFQQPFMSIVCACCHVCCKLCVFSLTSSFQRVLELHASNPVRSTGQAEEVQISTSRELRENSVLIQTWKGKGLPPLELYVKT